MKAAQAAPELLEAFLTTVGRQGLQPEHCKAFKWTAALPVRLRVSRRCLLCSCIETRIETSIAPSEATASPHPHRVTWAGVAGDS
jgi:hypothetical protein